MTRVVVFGSVNADLIFAVETLPTPGQTLLASALSVEPGGKGANQAVAAALDGAPTILAGAVGADALSEVALRGLLAAGVDVSRVVQRKTPTGSASICIDRDGRNQIVVARGANLEADGDTIEEALLGPDTVVVTQMENDPTATAAMIRRAKRHGARTIQNLAPAAPLAPDALRLLDVLVVNEDEAAWLARHEGLPGGDAAALHVGLGVTVIRTLGGAGVEWAGRGGHGRLTAAPIHAVDTTAAGDCFVGVLAAAWMDGVSLHDAIHRANVAAGLACTRRGSQGSLPSSTEISRSIREETAQ
jgi:ribokinase